MKWTFPSDAYHTCYRRRKLPHAFTISLLAPLIPSLASQDFKTNISGPSSSALTTWNIPEPRADAQVPGPRRTTLLLFWTCKRNELHEGVSYNHVKVLLKAFLSTSDMLRVPTRAHTLTKFQIGSKKKFAVVCQTSELIYKFQATPQVLREGTGELDGVRNPYGRWTPPYFYRNTQCV